MCTLLGSEVRRRYVQWHPRCGGTSCPSLKESKSCLITGDKNCTVQSWMTWTACSNQCGFGNTTRTRNVLQQKQCNGTCPHLTESKACEEYVPINCTLGSWTGWSDCSTRCRVPGSFFKSQFLLCDSVAFM